MASTNSPACRFVEIDAVLRGLARVFSQAQQVIDRRSLDLLQEFRDLDAVGFSLVDNSLIRIPDAADGPTQAAVLPLSSLASLRRYRILELRVEFALVPENDSSDLPGGQGRFRVVPLDSQAENVRLACLRVVGKERISAEFQIAGEVKGTLVPGGS